MKNCLLLTIVAAETEEAYRLWFVKSGLSAEECRHVRTVQEVRSFNQNNVGAVIILPRSYFGKSLEFISAISALKTAVEEIRS